MTTVAWRKRQSRLSFRKFQTCLERSELLLGIAPRLQGPSGSFIALFWSSTHLNLVWRPHSPLKSPVIVAACLLVLLQASDCHCNGNNTAQYIEWYFTVLYCLMPPGRTKRLYSLFLNILGRPGLFLCGLGKKMEIWINGWIKSQYSDLATKVKCNDKWWHPSFLAAFSCTKGLQVLCLSFTIDSHENDKWQSQLLKQLIIHHHNKERDHISLFLKCWKWSASLLFSALTFFLMSLQILFFLFWQERQLSIRH